MFHTLTRRAALLGLCVLLVLPSLAGAEADFSASGLSAGGTPQQLGKADSYGSGKVSRPMPPENPVADGVNPITGESFTGDYQLSLVNIDTHPSALPHWGVSAADLTYEMPIQADGSTRSLALFMGEYPDSAGPIRSARVPMCSLREMWGGTYCFYGYQGGRDSNNVPEWVKKHSEGRRFAYPAYLNGMTKNSGWFPRSSDADHVAPYNVRLNMNALKSDYALTPTPHPFLFSDGLDHGEDVNGLIISYKETSPAYVTAYQYNEQTGLYDRFRNGEAYIDANNGEACAYANVIVLRTDISWASGNPSRPVIRLNGEGVAEIFQNGKYIRGSWARDCSETKNLQNRMVFFDENGEELPMKPGKTFIQIVDNLQPVVVLAEESIDGAVKPQEQRLTIGEGASQPTRRPRETRTPKPTATPKPTSTPTAVPAPTETPSPVPTETPAPELNPAPETDAQPEPPVQPETPDAEAKPEGEPTAPDTDVKPEGEQTAPDSDVKPEGEQTAPETGNTDGAEPPAQNSQPEQQPDNPPADTGKDEADGAPDAPADSAPQGDDAGSSDAPADSAPEQAPAESVTPEAAPQAESAAPEQAPAQAPAQNAEQQSSAPAEESADA